MIFPPPLVEVQRGPCGSKNYRCPWWSKIELYISITTRNIVVGIQWLAGERSIRNNIAGGGLFIFKGSTLQTLFLSVQESLILSVIPEVLLKNNFWCVFQEKAQIDNFFVVCVLYLDQNEVGPLHNYGKWCLYRDHIHRHLVPSWRRRSLFLVSYMLFQQYM